MILYVSVKYKEMQICVIGRVISNILHEDGQPANKINSNELPNVVFDI